MEGDDGGVLSSVLHVQIPVKKGKKGAGLEEGRAQGTSESRVPLLGAGAGDPGGTNIKKKKKKSAWVK